MTFDGVRAGRLGRDPQTAGASFETTDPEAARDHLARAYSDNALHPRGPVEDFWMENSFQAVGPVVVSTVRHSTGVQYEAAPGLDATMLAYTGTGRVERSTAGETVRAGVGTAFLMAEPHRPYEIGFEGPMELRMLVLEPVAFSDLTDRYLPTSDGLPRFTSLSAVSAALSRTCVEVAEFVRTTVAPDVALREQPLIRDSAARMLAAAIVALFPHETVDDQQDHGEVASIAVRRAVDFIEAHAGEPIGVAEMAQHAGIGPRALQLAFRRHLGLRPPSI